MLQKGSTGQMTHRKRDVGLVLPGLGLEDLKMGENLRIMNYFYSKRSCKRLNLNDSLKLRESKVCIDFRGIL